MSKETVVPPPVPSASPTLAASANVSPESPVSTMPQEELIRQLVEKALLDLVKSGDLDNIVAEKLMQRSASSPVQEKILPTREEMREMIANLHPKREVYAGIRYLNLLLEEKGVEGVIAFVMKASEALDKGDGLDLFYNFDDTETIVFHDRHVRPNMTRRNFLQTVGLGFPGTVYAVAGLSDVGHQVASFIAANFRKQEPNETEVTPFIEPEPTQNTKDTPDARREQVAKTINPPAHPPKPFSSSRNSTETWFSTIHDFNHKYFSGLENGLIGAALVNEAVGHWTTIKLEQIGDAVIQFEQKLKEKGHINAHQDIVAKAR